MSDCDATLHRTLARQMRRLGLDMDGAPTADQWRALLARVSETYAQFDDDHYTMERAMELSSNEMQQLHNLLARQARTDGLTGLANRASLLDDLTAALAYAPGAQELGVLFIDLDGFKVINDTLGHEAGDEVLVQTASRLRSTVRAGDIVARYGGDEFVALLHRLTDATLADVIARRIVSTLAEPFVLTTCSKPVRIGASVGIALAEPGVDAAGLVRTADGAMYLAKARGKGRIERASCRLSNARRIA